MKDKNRLTRALKRKNLSVNDLLNSDRGIDAVIDLMNTLRSHRRINHMMVIILNKDNKLTTFSDLGVAAELLVLEQAKKLTIGTCASEKDLICDFEEDLIDDDEGEDDLWEW